MVVALLVSLKLSLTNSDISPQVALILGKLKLSFFCLWPKKLIKSDIQLQLLNQGETRIRNGISQTTITLISLARCFTELEFNESEKTHLNVNDITVKTLLHQQQHLLTYCVLF